MILKIDEVSSRTVGRFVAKLALALVPRLPASPRVRLLSVLAWFTAILAVMRRYRFDPDLVHLMGRGAVADVPRARLAPRAYGDGVRPARDHKHVSASFPP